MATEMLVNQEPNKMEHDPTMASIAGPSQDDFKDEKSMEENWASKADQATPQGNNLDQAEQFE